ncbi:MAG: RNA-binding cell elongation regulator Jag/EloR [Bacilli bacterium]|nr:RNA-binding cell elongation regulator Jag/EloR [Bacilli bacterium]MDY6430433.1 RNA-binding cell elongation regulator Jag/EloR [Bacilli bacterium]
MKEYTGKTVEEAVKMAAEELSIDAEKLVYEVKEEKKSLFKKVATIVVFEIEDAAEFAGHYLENVLESLGVEADVEHEIQDNGLIKITISSEVNPILIGKSGRTLQALSELTKLAVSNKFKRRFHILVDIGGYKQDRYSRIARLAKKTANQVLRTHVDAQLDPMTTDERRVVHNVLSSWDNIKTESKGVGPDRAVTIKYVG